MLKEKTVSTDDFLLPCVQKLDILSRIYLGQYDEITFHYGPVLYSQDERLRGAFLSLRSVFQPELPPNLDCSRGIWGTKTPMTAVKAYDLQQSIRYLFAWKQRPAGGYTVNFRNPFFHGEWKMTKEERKQMEEILREADCYPEYRKNFSILNPWQIPFVLKDIEKNSVMLYDPEQIDPLFELAEATDMALQEKDVGKALSILYPEEEEARYREAADIVGEALKENA